MIVSRNKTSSPAGALNSATFDTPFDLLERFEQYIDFTRENPLPSEKLVGDKGMTGIENKLHIPDFFGFCYFCKCTSANVRAYRDKGDDWDDVLTFIEEAIHSISYRSAAAGLVKESIVMRKLGLAEKVEVSGIQRRIVILPSPQGRLIEDASTEEIEDTSSKEGGKKLLT